MAAEHARIELRELVIVQMERLQFAQAYKSLWVNEVDAIGIEKQHQQVVHIPEGSGLQFCDPVVVQVPSSNGRTEKEREREGKQMFNKESQPNSILEDKKENKKGFGLTMT